MVPEDDVIRGFRERYGGAPEALASVPGRINLVGEHVDYLLLPVLPMAVQRGIRMAVRGREDGRVRLRNADPAFPAAELHPAVPAAAGDWSQYVRAALGTVGAARGFDAFVASDLPPAAGLSSSSALVVAAALAALHANGRPLDRLALADALAQGERGVGTEGGGMDQAVILCARAGAALRIDFAPLRVRPIPVPADWRFVVAPSLQESRKSAEVRAGYNERSRSARTALAALAPGLRGDALAAWIGSSAPAEPELPPRLRHVVGEARRVAAATAALEQDDPAAFGRLMSASHASLRDDYLVSTAALDEIVAIALDAGALGARLTGAGFGGAAIALCTADTEARVRDALEERFYRPRGAASAAFTAVPAAGAQLVPV